MARLETFKAIFREKIYLAELFIGFFAYLFIFILIVHTNKFIIINSESRILIGTLIVTSSFILTLATYIIRNSAKPSGYAGSIYSLLVSIFGSFFASCGCQAPLLMTILYTIGLNAIEATWFMSIIVSYNNYILLAFIAINLLLIYYYLGKGAQYTESGKKEILGKVFTK
ncbi:MAG: hypothetical protein ACP5HW_01685 [Candidatus Micrarchaeia archaeon]|jgi:hypothetical protein